ncbi:helix-turn-helix transcriptional regulator [Neisseria chenwenguii]|nr:helix-turn-helix transcriptional regulator [Neisseria chenwenguii]
MGLSASKTDCRQQLLTSNNDTYLPIPTTLVDHPDIQVIGQMVQISKDLN